MPIRTAKFASAVLANVLAGALLAIASHHVAHAADNCLSAPKDETPEGSHWYYRIDHATKRHCWYLRAEGEKVSQTGVSSNDQRSVKPAAPSAETQRSVENARAELPPRTTIGETSNDTLTPADTAAGAEDTAATTPAAEASRSVIASRWPESSDTTSPIGLPPPTINPAANAGPVAAADPPPTGSTVRLATADASPQAPSGSIARLLSAMTGALALAGIVASLVLKLAARRNRPPARLRVRRDAAWEPTDDDRIVLPDQPDVDILPRRAGFARKGGQSAHGNHRVAEFYAQISRQMRG